jgi:hypothetical protein
MKQLITIFILFISLGGQAQSSLKTQAGNSGNLHQYVWSFSKNRPVSNEKALIDFNVMDNWKQLGVYLSVSPDGNFFAYTINKPNPAFRYSGMFLNKQDSLIIQSTHNTWRQAFAGTYKGFFSADSRQYIFQNGTILSFLQLGANKVTEIKDVTSFKTDVKNDWVAYQTKGKDSLILKNVSTAKEKYFVGIKNYEFDKSGEWLTCQNTNKEFLLYNLSTGRENHFLFVIAYSLADDGKTLLLRSIEQGVEALKYVSLIEDDPKIIFSKKAKTGIGNYSLDASGQQTVFIIVDSAGGAGAMNDAIWYYKAGMDKAVLKINNQTSGIPKGLTLSNTSFTNNGRYIKFSLQPMPKEVRKPNANMVGLEVWNHKDLYLQSTQLQQFDEVPNYNAIASVESGKIVLLENDDKKIDLLHGDFALVKKNNGNDIGDRFWEEGKNGDSCWVASLKDGSSQLLPTKSKKFWFSPGGNYLVYFDADKGCHYFSYDLHTGIVNDISANVSENQLGIVNRENDQTPKMGNLAAWVENDASVLVYDNYDIWKLDLSGKNPAVNITNGFGEANRIIFNLMTTDHYSSEVPVVKANETLALRGYNASNKFSGFYKKANLNAGAPAEMYMGNYFISAIEGCHDPNLSNRGMAPIKAKSSNTWIVQRQSFEDAPNYYETKDFRTFGRLTNYQPQKDYQWLREELHCFKQLDGKTAQGILYKPENFDSNKKYPVLIVFYGAFSDNMYQFPVPTGNYCAISPGQSPIWFLSNGYLVFTPDISVAPLKYGPKAFSVIEGAAKYLQQLPYIDANKLGYAAHSWSAQLGAYLFAHSTSFSAVCISEGLGYADPLNMALSPNNGKSRMADFENERQFGSLWENKESWLDQTTVLKADKSKAPLLLFCNKESTPDYQDQTFQFFNALRRLDKNVWWLKYDKGEHTLSDPTEIKDYTIRYTQFFDHYLKNAPAPLWMTEGIPYKLKGIESRYELDPKGQCNATNGERCPICEVWNKQYARTPEMFKKEITDWTLDKDIADELEKKQNERRKELDKLGEIQTKQVMEMLNAPVKNQK